jgi:Flp pilus assembly protein TadB
MYVGLYVPRLTSRGQTQPKGASELFSLHRMRPGNQIQDSCLGRRTPLSAAHLLGHNKSVLFFFLFVCFLFLYVGFILFQILFILCAFAFYLTECYVRMSDALVLELQMVLSFCVGAGN